MSKHYSNLKWQACQIYLNHIDWFLSSSSCNMDWGVLKAGSKWSLHLVLWNLFNSTSLEWSGGTLLRIFTQIQFYFTCVLYYASCIYFTARGIPSSSSTCIWAHWTPSTTLRRKSNTSLWGILHTLSLTGSLQIRNVEHTKAISATHKDSETQK